MPLRAFSELKRHFSALEQTRCRQYKEQLQILYDFLRSTPVFRSSLEAIEARYPADAADDWISEHVADLERPGFHRWPNQEGPRMRVLLRTIESMLADGQRPMDWGTRLAMTRNLQDGTDAITREVVLPLVNYLLAQLGTESEMLHLLGRFKCLVEWFEQKNLYAAYEADTGRGEAVYDISLRRFLFTEGIDFPFSQPASASGKADVVAAIETDDPLVLELKLFDGDKYGIPRIATGLGQAIRYAQDYRKAVGHLVVINLSDKRLDLPTDGPSDAPTRIVTEGVTVFLTVVQGKPRPSASEEGKTQTVMVKREQLVVEGDR